MGKKSKKQYRGRKQDIDDRDKDGNLEMANELFEAYYHTQGLLSELEWSTCLSYLKKGLPTTFRISGSRLIGHSLNDVVKNVYVPHLRNVKITTDIEEEEDIKPPEQLPWYPEGLGWQFNVPKRVLRKYKEFKRFHEFLIYETDVGNISRQEAVSMVPPLFLGVVPGDTVLDMCAAPGSKTAQLLEALHAPVSSLNPPPGPGLLIANDSDIKRAHLLIHQSARIPSDKFMVTNLEASRFPWLHVAQDSNNEKSRLRFTKILCDVPCSGDGTLRKNPGIWKKWNIGNGNGLHSLQLRILQRAMAMLAWGVNGRIVYSTCSMNPVENEAVIAAALNSVPGFELVDVQSYLPNLGCRGGVEVWYPQSSSWNNVKIPSLKHRSWASYKSAHSPINETQPTKETSTSFAKTKHRLEETMFPPENVQALHLDRCLRFYPHIMDTGGFFVAVLKRTQGTEKASTKSQSVGIPVSEQAVNSLPLKRKIDENFVEELHQPISRRVKTVSDARAIEGDEYSAMEDTAGPNREERLGKTSEFKEPPFTFLPEDHPHVVSVRTRLNFNASFPYTNLFVHTALPPSLSVYELPARIMYLANPLVKSLIENNDYSRMRLVHAGSKVLARQEKEGTQFRVMDEGLETIIPYLRDETVIKGDLDDLKPMLKEYYPFFNKLKPGSFRDSLEQHANGNVMAKFSIEGSENLLRHHSLTLALWKSSVSVSLMVNKTAKRALSLRLLGEDITAAASKNTSADSEDHSEEHKVDDARAESKEPSIQGLVTP